MRMSKQQTIRAAGGIISRPTPGGREILVIHRARYHDWSLPKGKLQAGESFEEAALREVKEETGIDAVMKGFAGSVSYTVGAIPKQVLFWHMEVEHEGAFKPSEEVLESRWLKIDEALGILTYTAERDLLARVYPGRNPR